MFASSQLCLCLFVLVLVRSAAAGASEVPVIDIGALFGDDETAQLRVARAIRSACVEWGFFYISQHGIDASLIAELAAVSREFFALPADEKSAIEMARAGRAWRGFFPVGGEFTSGKPDQKEGIYFGEELPADDERVRAGRPMHGANLFPARPASMRAVVLRYMAEMRKLANVVMRGIALALELPRDFFERDVTADPLQLFRIFHYPALGSSSSDPDAWSVGAHTDYGLLTLLLQDDVGGRRAADRRHVCVQSGRHARKDHWRLVQVDAAPRAQQQQPQPPLVAVLFRPELEHRDPASARISDARRGARRRGERSLGRRQRARRTRPLRTVAAPKDCQSLSRLACCDARRRRIVKHTRPKTLTFALNASAWTAIEQ
jgi:isopenicillin N synthase-like dioxygenase